MEAAAPAPSPDRGQPAAAGGGAAGGAAGGEPLVGDRLAAALETAARDFWLEVWLTNNPCPDPGIAIRARPSISPASSEVKPPCTDLCRPSPASRLPCVCAQSGSRASSRGGSRPPSCPRSPQLLSPPRSPPLSDGFRSPPRCRSPAVGGAAGAAAGAAAGPSQEVAVDSSEEVRPRPRCLLSGAPSAASRGALLHARRWCGTLCTSACGRCRTGTCCGSRSAR